MQQIKINELKAHPRNNEFFDDMQGEKWKEFLESIRTSGVIEPVVITTEKVIVSGHQRVRACEELGIDSVLCEIKSYKDEDAIIKDLLETNIRQRGDVGGSAKKVGLRIKELERLYGVKHGGDREASLNNSNLLSQSDIANQLGISIATLHNYKMLSDMIPELEELIDTGIVTKTTAIAIMKNLSEDEQEELISSLDTTKRITQSQIKKYIDEIKSLKENPPKPSDYDSIKKELRDTKQDYSMLRQEFDRKNTELQEIKNKENKMKESSQAEQYNKKLKDSTIFFCSRVADFIEKTGGYVWLVDHLNELPEYERKSYISAVKAVYAWASALLDNINE